MPLLLSTNDRVCFTGKMRRDRSMMDTIAVQAGLHPTTKVSDCAVVVVTGALPGPGETTKLKAARKRGCRIITEAQFLQEEHRLRAAVAAPPPPPPPPPGPKPPVKRRPAPDLIGSWTPSPSAHSCKI